MLAGLICAAALQNGLMAVLELKNKLGADVDAGFLADEVRSAALKTVPGLRVVTRENMLMLLRANNRKLEDCEGECEVDTGRLIGADLVVSGELLKFGSSYKLDLKLHKTADGQLLSGAIASGKTIDELDAGVGAAVKELLAPLVPAAASPPPEQQRPPQQQELAPAAPPPAQRPAPAVRQEPPAKQPPSQSQAPVKLKPGTPRQLVSPSTLLAVAGVGPQSLRESKSGLDFVRIPTGVAHLGCASGDNQCLPDEKPARTAQMPAFLIGRTEVPVHAYAACVQARACSGAPRQRDVPANKSCNWHNRRPMHPMNCVTWTEAQAFCRWIGGRLPTAAQWEYAAKSGDDVIFPWGNEPATGRRANFCDVNCKRALPKAEADETQDDGFAMTAPVGSYPAGASKWGLFDMAGNVVEWTATPWGAEKEIKGGNWAHPAANLRASHRFHAAADHEGPAVGFRCVQP